MKERIIPTRLSKGVLKKMSLSELPSFTEVPRLGQEDAFGSTTDQLDFGCFSTFIWVRQDFERTSFHIFGI